MLIVGDMTYQRYPAFRERHQHRLHLAVVRDPFTRAVSAWRYCSSTRHRSLRDSLDIPPPREHEHDWVHFTRTQFDGLSLVGEGGERALFVDCVFRFEELQRLLQWCNAVFWLSARVDAVDALPWRSIRRLCSWRSRLRI